MSGARANPGCELCKRERQHRQEAIDNILAEKVAHIQSEGEDKDRQLESLWRDTRIGDVLGEDVVDEVQRLLDISKSSRNLQTNITKMESRKTTKR